MASIRGKWFETKDHRVAKKFAAEKKLSLWKIETVKKDPQGGKKMLKTCKYYAGAALPATAKGKGVTVNPILNASA